MDSHSSSRPFQFSLRTLLIVVALLAVPCAYLHFTSWAAQKRAAALERIKKLGGEVVWLIDAENEKPEFIALPASTSAEDLLAIRDAFPLAPIFPSRADGSVIFDPNAWSKRAPKTR